MGPEADDAATRLVDEVATLLVAADAGDVAAETEFTSATAPTRGSTRATP